MAALHTSVPARLAAFAAVLVLTFAAAALAGNAIDPTDAPVASGHGVAVHHGEEHGEGAGLGGLAVSEGGYSLEVDRTTFLPGTSAALRFRITDADGAAVRDFETLHARELHLIVVRRDTAAFQHLHPVRDPDGTWSIDLTLPEPGVYRMYADFSIGGEQRTLATDLFVPGDFEPAPFPATPRQSRVALQTDELHAGAPAQMRFTVSGNPVIEPYLAARGHLVALREGDLAYLHVHPLQGAGSTIAFAATFPTGGRYRMFLQYKTLGTVHTESFTVEVDR